MEEERRGESQSSEGVGGRRLARVVKATGMPQVRPADAVDQSVAVK
jgi:hypothetical protein